MWHVFVTKLAFGRQKEKKKKAVSLISRLVSYLEYVLMMYLTRDLEQE